MRLADLLRGFPVRPSSARSLLWSAAAANLSFERSRPFEASAPPRSFEASRLLFPPLRIPTGLPPLLACRLPGINSFSIMIILNSLPPVCAVCSDSEIFRSLSDFFLFPEMSWMPRYLQVACCAIYLRMALKWAPWVSSAVALHLPPQGDLEMMILILQTLQKLLLPPLSFC